MPPEYSEPAVPGVTADGYLVIEANVRGGRVQSAKLARVTQRAPYLEGSQVAVRLKVKLPMSVFDAAIAEVVVEVPPELVSTPDVAVLPVR
jgi:hypothetical protein